MEKVTHKQLTAHLKRAYEIAEISIFIHGKAGIGKSDCVRDCGMQIAKEKKLEFTENGDESEKTFCFRDVRLAQMESVDLRGVPKIDEKEQRTKWFTPEWLPHNPNSHGILFFDEMNTAFVSVQNASLELVLNRRLGSYHLPKGWMIISAGNMADDKAHIFEMSAPLRARFKHFELQVPTIEEWSAWAMEHGINPNIVAFLNFKPEYLHKFNEDSREESFPNPRSWMFASKSIDGITDIKFIEREVASCVGKGVAMEFSAWYKMNDKVDLNAIIKTPETVKKIREMSLKYSIVAGLAEKYKANKDIFDSVLAVCKHIEPEFGYILLGYVKTADRNAFAKKVVSSKIWKEIASIYGKYMDD